MSHSSSAPRRRRRIRLWPFLLGLAVIVVGLALLALPFRSAPGEAEAAKADLQAARDAMADGDLDAARASVASARQHADSLQGSVQGIGGDVWSWVPLAAGPVRDVRRLGTALDELVGVAEVGVGAWPQISGEKATLYDNGNVDLPTLDNMTDDLEEASASLQRAQGELEEISDSRLLGGARFASARDEALDQVTPMVDGIEALDPVIEVLPRILGSEGDRDYILALLNPSEMMYSGGTPQSYFTLGVRQGQLQISETLDFHNSPWIAQNRHWKKVHRNPFHRGKLKMATSTMAPDWSISGQEMATAWQTIRRQEMAGVIVVDVVALSDLVALTGPVDLPGLGRVTADNLVKTLVGSYDEHSDNTERHEMNQALGNLFRDRLLAGSPLDTARVLDKAADQRRFAVYFRDEDEQAAFDGLGLTGRLGSPQRDYLGVFTQNRVASKSDYWQRRSVRSDVRVNEDGSARVTLSIEVHNDSAPYAHPGEDPKRGYWTRWNHLSVMAMLPGDASVTQRRVDGEDVVVRQYGFYDHQFTRQIIDFAPQDRHVFEISYDVASVADVEDGSLVYGLDIDPQGMVNPQAVDVRVRFPRGFEVDDLPAGWTSPKPGVARFTTPGLSESESFEVRARS